MVHEHTDARMKMFEIVRFDSKITSVTSVRNAMYRMSARHGLICRLDGDEIVVESHAQLDEAEILTLTRHVNDYQLREIIKQETASVRDAVLAAALIRITETQIYQ